MPRLVHQYGVLDDPALRQAILDSLRLFLELDD